MKTKRNNPLVVRIATRTRNLLLSQASGLRLLALSAVAVTGNASAASGDWSHDGTNNNWSTATSWSSNPTVPGTIAGDVITFINNITAARTITIDTTPRTVGSLTIGDSNNTHGFTIAASGGGNLTFDNGMSNATLTENGSVADTISAPITLNSTLAVTSNGSLTLSGIVSGTQGITKEGSGTLTFSSSTANTYSGGTTINAGTLVFATTAAMPASGAVTVNTGTTLTIAVGQAGEFTNATSGAGSFGGVLAGTGVGASTVSYSGDVTVGIDIAGANVTYSGVIANPSGATSLGITKFNGNNLTLTGASTYTGVTRNNSGGILVATIGNTGLTSSPLGVNNTAMDFFGTGELEYTGAGETSNRLINISGTGGTIRTGTNTGALVLSAAINPTSTVNKTLTLLGTSTLANTVSGNISNGASGTLGVTKNLAGTWVLSGTNTYTGSTTLIGGKLVLAGAGALPSGSQIVWGTTNTRLAFQNDTNRTVGNTWNTATRNITRTLEVDRLTSGSAVNLTFSSAPALDTGTVFNFQKGSNITSGTPTITFSAGFGNTDSNNATISSSASTFTPTDVNLVINGISSTNRTRGYIFSGNTDGNQITGTFSNGNGTSIRKTGTGTWTLNGTSQYTGTTEVNNGTLKFGRQSALYNSSSSSWTAANISVQIGATLAFNVGGTNEFTTGNVTTLLTNLAASTSATNGMNAGSNLGFDTSNASGGTFTISNAIENTTGASGGNRGLTKLGTGTLVLTGTNTYDGATTVSAGTLAVNGDQSGSAGAVTVATGATLAGTGTVGGATTIQSGGFHAPGNSPGTQTFSGDLTYSSGSTFNWEITTGTNTYDKVIVGGTLGGTGATFNIASSTTFDNSFWDTSKTWTDIFTTNGTTGIDYSGIFSSITTTTPLLDRGSFSITGSTLNWTAVPEASNLLIGGLVGLGLMARRRKQQ